MFIKFISVSLLALISCSALAERIAVTDLTYTDRMSGYFRMVDYHSSSNSNSNFGNTNNGSYARNNASTYNNYSNNSHTDYSETNAVYNYIIYGELRKFVGDIKGEIIKTGQFQLTQAKPFVTKGTESIYDVIDRIKKGYFPNADWVLFGTVSDISFRNEINPVIGSNNSTTSFDVTLAAEFSLINTRTYEIKAAFSSIGEGQDTKIVSPGSIVIPNRTKAISEVSKSIGSDVSRQLLAQFNGESNNPAIPNDPSQNSTFKDANDGQVYRY